MRPANPPVTAIETIVCPQCEAALDPSTDACPYCGASTSDQPAEAQRRRMMDRPWVIVIVLLHVGVLGIPYYWKTRYSTRTRIIVVALSIVYTVFAAVVITWAVLQIIHAVRVLST